MDSIKIDDITPKKTFSFKLVIMIFISFILVISDVFNHSVINKISSNAFKNREITTTGIMLQGISLVILFSISSFMINNDII